MTSPWPLVLMYHGIIARSTDVDINALGMLVQDAFVRQLEQLKKHYSFMHPDEFTDRLVSNRPFPRSSALITFDDGFQNVLNYALPVAEAMGVPMLVFISTGHLDQREWLWFSRYRAYQLIQGQELPISLRDLLRLPIAEIESELDKMGAPKRANSSEQMHSFFDGIDCDRLRRAVGNGILSVGGHTVRHPILINERPEIRVQEIVNSKIELERIINGPVRLFAYPNDSYDDAVAEQVKEAGYEGAFIAGSLDVSMSDRLRAFKIPRTGINRGNMVYFWWRVLGVGSSLKRVARIGSEY
jgi:peptidoglycan/xylan/chitin deacetylase (PgdA/CDA1 family)